MSLWGHPLGRAMEKWWKEHAQRHDDPEWLRWISVYEDIVAEKLTEQSTEHSNMLDGDKLFGMSGVGSCVRDRGLSYLGFPDEQSGSSMWTFWIGHSLECSALATITCILTEEVKRQVPVTIGPFMSASDAHTKLYGLDTVVSVKSMAYKMSGRKRVKGGGWEYTRRGFAELPFQGMKASHPSYYAQMAVELEATGFKQGLFVVCAKDIVKAYENDDYLGYKGNGSLSFYCEIVRPEPEIARAAIDMFSERLEYVQHGEAGKPYYLSKDYRFVELVPHEYIEENVWGGENQKRTGTFNPCGGCGRLKACEEEK